MIDILYAGNVGVFDGMIISALSAAKSTSESLHIHIFTMDLTDINERFLPVTEAQAKFVERIIKEENQKSTVTLYDVRKLYLENFKDSPNALSSYTPYALVRLIADRVEGIPDKLIYLDTDTVVRRDISELYLIDVSDYEYAAVRDYFGKIFFGFNYINTGVLLLNMKKIRETGLFVKTARDCRERKIFLADQSALNANTEKSLILPSKFNEQKKIHENTVIRHFSMTIKWFPFFHTKNIKPWHVNEVRNELKIHEFDEILDKYIELKEEFDKNYIMEEV